MTESGIARKMMPSSATTEMNIWPSTCVTQRDPQERASIGSCYRHTRMHTHEPNKRKYKCCTASRHW
jgi:hypothetical protein